MSQSRLADYLERMHEAASQACAYVEDMDKDAFLEEKRTQQAVILNLLIIGEIATKLLNEFTPFLDQHPEIPWRSMKGMRNRIAHGYFDINMEIVWETVATALPTLLQALPEIQKAARS